MAAMSNPGMSNLRCCALLSLLALAFTSCQDESVAAGETAGPPGMVLIPGGEFSMGTDAVGAMADEQPVHRVRVSGFWMDTEEVTNAQFAEFVDATGYVTTAEQAPGPGEEAGSMVFAPPAEETDARISDVMEWWAWSPGTDWRHPEGPDSDLLAIADVGARYALIECALLRRSRSGIRAPVRVQPSHFA